MILTDPHRSGRADLSVRRFAIHGLALELRCDLPGVMAEVETMLGLFEVGSWPEGFHPIVGSVELFDADNRGPACVAGGGAVPLFASLG